MMDLEEGFNGDLSLVSYFIFGCYEQDVLLHAFKPSISTFACSIFRIMRTSDMLMRVYDYDIIVLYTIKIIKLCDCPIIGKMMMV